MIECLCLLVLPTATRGALYSNTCENGSTKHAVLIVHITHDSFLNAFKGKEASASILPKDVAFFVSSKQTRAAICSDVFTRGRRELSQYEG